MFGGIACSVSVLIIPGKMIYKCVRFFSLWSKVRCMWFWGGGACVFQATPWRWLSWGGLVGAITSSFEPKTKPFDIWGRDLELGNGPLSPRIPSNQIIWFLIWSNYISSSTTWLYCSRCHRYHWPQQSDGKQKGHRRNHHHHHLVCLHVSLAGSWPLVVRAWRPASLV